MVAGLQLEESPKRMSCVKLPSLRNRSSLCERNPGYQSSYKRDFQLKSPLVRAPLRPTSVSRRHNPQPKHVFLLRRMFNEPVCNVWTPSGEAVHPSLSKVSLARKALMTCAQYSYTHTPNHPNFTSAPTRFGANKEKLSPAVGIVPVTAVWKNELASSATEPLKMDVTGKRRKLTAAYVLDQQLPQYEAVEDMKERANGSRELYLSHAITKPSRRKHLQTRPTCLAGCSPVVSGRGRRDADDVMQLAAAASVDGMDKSLVQRQRGEFYTLHQPWPACYSCWAGPL